MFLLQEQTHNTDRQTDAETEETGPRFRLFELKNIVSGQR